MTEIPFEYQKEYFPIFDRNGNYTGGEYPKLVLRLDGDMVEVAAQDPTDKRLDTLCSKERLSVYRVYLKARGISADAPEKEIAKAIAEYIGAPIY